MASPSSVSRTETEVATASASWTVNLDPNLASGDLLIIVLREAVGFATTWPAGYDNFLSDGTNTWHDFGPDAGDDIVTVIARDCDGAEASSITVTLSSAGKGCAVAYRISGATPYATQAPDLLSATGNDANPDCPSESVTGGPKDILALALDTHQGEQTATVTYPTNYVNTGQATSGTAGTTPTNCQINYCDLQVTAASSENPSAFTISGANNWIALTILVQEPAGAAATSLIYPRGMHQALLVR